MECPECLADLGLGGPSINDENHGIFVFHLLHVLLGDEGVLQDHVEIESLRLGEGLLGESVEIVKGILSTLQT